MPATITPSRAVEKPLSEHHPVSVAPMMDWTDRACRFFHRLISPRAILYTEMIHAQAVLHNAARVLPFDAEESPIVLQLGGSNPETLARAAKIGQTYGYDAINLNCGCPSDRVQDGRFGACLMREPDLVAACVEAMSHAVSIPVSVKCRTGLDGADDPAFLDRFVSAVKQAGCKTIILHARTAMLKGLSPKENREIPPLRPDMAAAIKAAHPDLNVVLNGGLRTAEQTLEALRTFDGVMIGREAYHNPMCLAQIDSALGYGPPPERERIAHLMIPYIERRMHVDAIAPHAVFRHMLGLYAGMPGAARWRRIVGDAPATARCPPAETIRLALGKKSG